MIGVDMLILIIMVAGLVIFVGEPLVRQQPAALPNAVQAQEVEQLSLHKEILYTAIRDLDFDYQTGKVDQQDYTTLRQQLEGEAIQALRALDAVDPLAALDNELERQIVALRHGMPSEAIGATVIACPQCGVRLQGDEHFCAACGQALQRL
jgi:hypothetical protein